MTPASSGGTRVIVTTADELRAIIREELAHARAEELLTPTEVAAITKKHPKTVRGWLRAGLQHQKAGQRKLIRRADLDAWLHRDKSAAHLRLLGGR